MANIDKEIIRQKRENNSFRKRELEDEIKHGYQVYVNKKNKTNLYPLAESLSSYWNEFITYDIELLDYWFSVVIKLPEWVGKLFVEQLNKLDLKENIYDFLPDTIKNGKKITPIKNLNYEPYNKALQTIINPYLSNDALRTNMMGTYFDDDAVVGTDAHRLIHLYKRNLIKESKITKGTYCTSKDCFNIFPQLLSNKSKNSLEDLDLVSKYPNYIAVVPNRTDNLVTFNTQELYNLILTLKKSKLLLGNIQTLNLKYGNLEFGMNANFLLDGLRTALELGWRNTTLDTTNTSGGGVGSAKVLTNGMSKEKDYLKQTFILIMPVMLNSQYGDNISFFTYHIDLKQGAFVSANIPYNLFQVDNSNHDTFKKLDTFFLDDEDLGKRKKSIIKEQAEETQKTIRVKWGQKESTSEWIMKEHGSYEDSGNSPSHVVGILEREYSKKKPYLEITIDEANTIKESAEYQNGAWEQDDINPDNENPPLKYYNTVMQGYVDRINKAKDTPSKTNDETEVIGGRKKKKLRQHKKTIKEQQEKATNKVEEYLAKIESYISLIEIESGKKKIEEYESKIEAYESLIELEEDNDDEYSETITDDDTGEVTEIIRKKNKQ